VKQQVRSSHSHGSVAIPNDGLLSLGFMETQLQDSTKHQKLHNKNILEKRAVKLN